MCHTGKLDKNAKVLWEYEISPCEKFKLRLFYVVDEFLCFLPSAEFKRAVKVATGQELSNNILDTVFKIFDLDGDECLSHEEFLGVLKNRMLL